jgi:hypothetical protein
MFVFTQRNRGATSLQSSRHLSGGGAQHRTGSRLAMGNDMSSQKEEFVVKELQELRNLETQLQMKRKRLHRAGEGVQVSFVSSLRELQSRTQQLEQLPDSPKRRAA